MAFDKNRIHELIADRDQGGLEVFLIEHSNLPGPRGNLELASATADLLGTADIDWVIELLDEWSRLSVEFAGGNDPRVMLPFVAAQTAGVIWPRATDEQRAELNAILHRSANDSRWRVREDAAMGLQRVGFANFADLQNLIDEWSSQPTLLEWRAIVAGLAEPPLLTEPSRAALGLDQSMAALDALLTVPLAERAHDNPRALRAALGYAISVFIAADSSGFSRLEAIAALPDKDARWIVNENLKKARIAKRYPVECARVAAIANR